MDQSRIELLVGMTPPRDLNPNAGKNRWSKTTSRDTFKQSGRQSVQDALSGDEWRITGEVSLDVEIHWQKGRRRLDFDNAVASLKHCVDGIFEELGMNDNQIVNMQVRQFKTGTEAGYMLMTIHGIG